MLAPLVLPALFSAADCARIIAQAEASDLAEARLVGGRRETGKRRARIAWLDDEGEGGWVFERLMRAISEANRTGFDFDVDAFEERSQVARYDAEAETGQGAGGFDWHSDVGEGPHARRRKLTVVTQLSAEADYDGGGLEVNGDGAPREAPRTQGDALAFPAFALHRVAPITRGRRWSLTLWAHGAPFR